MHPLLLVTSAPLPSAVHVATEAPSKVMVTLAPSSQPAEPLPPVPAPKVTVVPDGPELGLRIKVNPRAVGVGVTVAVGEGVSVGVSVAVGDGVNVDVLVAVGERVNVGVPVKVAVGEGVVVAVGVDVELDVAVTVNDAEPVLPLLTSVTETL